MGWYDESLRKLKNNKTKMKKIEKEVESFSLDKLKELCNYDGKCLLSDVLAEEFGFAFCYGNHCGKNFCPLTKIFKEFKVVKTELTKGE